MTSLKSSKLLPIFIGLFLLISLLFVSCRATSTPATQSRQVGTSAPSTPASIATPTSDISPLTSQDAAWTKVVEAAKKEGTLTIYSNNFTGEMGLAMSRGFRERYGIAVDIVTGRGAEFLERVKVEKRTGRPVADMTDGAAMHLMNMKKEGLTVSIASELPALREKDIWVADILRMDPQDKHLIGFNLSIYSAYVNTKIIKAGEEPKVWKDLLDPRWKGKMMLTDPTISAAPYQVFVPLLREKVIDEEFLKALYKQGPRLAVSQLEEGGLLSRGEFPVSLNGLDRVYSGLVREGAPIKAVELTDGTVLVLGTVAAYATAPHPNAAKVFINWFLSPEGQTAYSKAASAASVRKDVPNFLPEAAQIRPQHPIPMSFEDTGEATKRFTDRWLNKLWGR